MSVTLLFKLLTILSFVSAFRHYTSKSPHAVELANRDGLVQSMVESLVQSLVCYRLCLPHHSRNVQHAEWYNSI